jgi:hypothetical protein
MPLVTPVSWMQNVGAVNSAQVMRIADGGSAKGSAAFGANSIAGRGGILRRGAGLNLEGKQNGGGAMTILVEPGVAYVPGSEAVMQGGYWVAYDSTSTIGPFTTAHATLNRTDVVYLKVSDSIYSGASNTADILIQPGTAGGAKGSLTGINNALLLCEVTVRAGASTILTSDINNNGRFFAAPGGVQAVRADEGLEAGLHALDLSLFGANLRYWDPAPGVWRTMGMYSVASLGTIWNPVAEQLHFLSTTRMFNRWTGSAWQEWYQNNMRFYGSHTATLGIGSGSWTAIPLNVETKDTANGHSTSSNTSRYTFQRTGTYEIAGATGWAANAAGSRGCAYRTNGVGSFDTGTETLLPATPGGSHVQPGRTVQKEYVAGDYVELMGWQNTGSTVNEAGSTLAIKFLGDN